MEVIADRWWIPEDPGGEFTPIEVHAPESLMDDLTDRVAQSRLPFRWDEGDWEFGSSTAYLRDARDYWLDSFDWRATEERINRSNNVVTSINGQTIHAVHRQSGRPGGRPILLIHGWPSSFLEFEQVINPLADGGDDEPSAPGFDVVCVSLPGYGLSGPTTEGGWHSHRIGEALVELMARFGYPKFLVQGTDWGSMIAVAMAQSHAECIEGIQIGMALCGPPGTHGALGEVSEQQLALLTPAELEGLARIQWFWESDSGYSTIHSTRPHSIGVAMSDSPLGLLAWYVEKYRSWSDSDGDVYKTFTLDDVLSQVTLAWLTGTAESALRLYAEDKRAGIFAQAPHEFVSVPTAVTIYPAETVRLPRAWVEASYNLVRWSPMDAGGHFPAHEVPELWLPEVRAFAHDIAAHRHA
jgi:microsomal epoxide hydrolase